VGVDSFDDVLRSQMNSQVRQQRETAFVGKRKRNKSDGRDMRGVEEIIKAKQRIEHYMMKQNTNE
jgi:hypothetical protein